MMQTLPYGRVNNINLMRYFPKQQQGFSLLEVIIVLVIGALLMGTVVTSLTEGPVLRKAAREVASSLRHARSIAIMRQQATVWSLDIKSNQFWIENQKKEKRELHAMVSAKINTAASEVVSDSQGNIRFFPDGSSTGGSIEVTAKQQTFVVNVEWISGRITIQ